MTTNRARQPHGPLGIVRPTPNRHRRTTTPKGSASRGERAHESSSFESSSSFVSDWFAASSSSTAFLTIFLWMSGWGVIAFRITRRGIASVAGAPAGPPDTTVGAACDAEGVSEGAAPPTRWRGQGGALATGAPPPPPLRGRLTSRLNHSHLLAAVGRTG